MTCLTRNYKLYSNHLHVSKYGDDLTDTTIHLKFAKKYSKILTRKKMFCRNLPLTLYVDDLDAALKFKKVF